MISISLFYWKIVIVYFFFLRMLPTLSCPGSNRVNMTLWGLWCGGWSAIPGSKGKVKSSWFSGARQSPFPPFSIGLQAVFGKDMAWQRGGGEAGFLKAVILLTIIDTPNCSSAKVWGDRERKGSKSGLFCFISWRGAANTALSWSWNWWFKPNVWPATVVELCGKGPHASVPTCW